MFIILSELDFGPGKNFAAFQLLNSDQSGQYGLTVGAPQVEPLNLTKKVGFGV
jgi:hypothetical protein